MVSRLRDDGVLKRLLQFSALAVLVHLALMPLLEPFLPEAPPAPEGKRQVRVISLMSGKAISQNEKPPRKFDRPEAEKKEDEKKREPEAVTELDRQVVDLPPSPDDVAPEEYDFLSEHNTRVDRESVSRHRSGDYNAAMNERTRSAATTSAPKAQAQPAAINIGPASPDLAQEAQQQQQEMAFELPRIDKHDRLALDIDSIQGHFRNREQSEGLKGKRLRLSMGDAKPHAAGAMAPNQGAPNLQLMPEMGVLARLSGAPANDHIEGIEEGEGTFLNSREFKYASFFNRLKRGVSKQWRPLVEYRRRDPSGNVYGHRARITVLDVTLNADGSLKGVNVRTSSGVEFLDREAVSAFRRAEPFPNPPTGLVGTDGQITFPFGFHIDFNRRRGLPF